MAFFFLRNSLFLKNKRLLLFYADEYIDQLEKSAAGLSCKQDLLDAVSKDLDRYKKDIAALTDVNDNLKLTAKKIVSNIAFDLIESGKYHLHGRLNFFGPAKNLIYIHKTSVKEFLDSGFITQEEYEEDILALEDAIHQYL